MLGISHSNKYTECIDWTHSCPIALMEKIYKAGDIVYLSLQCFQTVSKLFVTCISFHINVGFLPNFNNFIHNDKECKFFKTNGVNNLLDR